MLDRGVSTSVLGAGKRVIQPKLATVGCLIGRPRVVAMAEKPYSVPAEGGIPYKQFVVDPGFAEDHWMTGCEVRLGSREVVHDVLVFCRVPGQRQMLDEFNGGLVAAYAAGLPAFQAPAGAARRLPAGSRIVIQMHDTPNGRAQEDLTRVGFTFCDRKDVKQEIESRGANSFLIRMVARRSYSTYRNTISIGRSSTTWPSRS